MRAVVTLARVGLRSRWRGWLSAALLVALAGGVVLVTAAGARRTATAYGRLLRSSRAADAELAVSDPEGRQDPGGASTFYAAVARLPGAEIVAATAGVSAEVVGRHDASILLKGGTHAGLGRKIERPKLTEGRLFDPGRADEVVADRTAAAQFDLHVGSTLHLVAGPPVPAGADGPAPVPLKVRVVGVGVTRDNVVAVTAFARQASLLVSPALLRRLGPSRHAYDAAFVRLHRGVAVPVLRRAAQSLVRGYPEAGSQLFVVDEHEQAAKVEHAIRPQVVALGVFALLVVLTSLLIVGQVLIRQVFIASGDHPTLRALGLSRMQLAAVGLLEGGFTVVVGAALAVVAAIALSALMPIGPARVAEPHPGVTANWAIVGFGALAIVVVFVLLVGFAVWRRASTSSRTDASHPGDGARPSAILETLHRTGAPVTVAVGARLALEPGRGRSSIPVRSTLAMTTIAVAAVAAAFTFGTNLVRLVNTPHLYGQTWQVAVDVEFDQISRRDADTFLRRQPGVGGWTFGNHAEAAIAGRRVAAIELTGGDGNVRFPTLLEGRTPHARNEIVLGTQTLAHAHRGVGQFVLVTLPSQPVPQAMRIIGRAVFPFFGQGEVTPTGLGDGAAFLDPTPSPDGFNFFLVNMTSGAHQQGNIARLARDLSAAQVCHQDCRAVTTQRPADVNNYARITATPLVLAGVLAVLAAATVAHLLVTAIRRRRRDLAVLKTLGFVRRQVSAAVAWQATIVVTLALLVGLPLGIAAGRGAWLYFATRLGVAAEAQIPLGAAILFVAATLLIANGIAAGPGWLAGRSQPGPVLRTE